MENRNWLRSFHSYPVIVLVHLFYFLFSAGLQAQNAKKEKIDMLVVGGTVVTMNAERRIIEDGAVAIKGDAIVAAGSGAKIEARNPAARRITRNGKRVLPGSRTG